MSAPIASAIVVDVPAVPKTKPQFFFKHTPQIYDNHIVHVIVNSGYSPIIVEAQPANDVIRPGDYYGHVCWRDRHWVGPRRDEVKIATDYYIKRFTADGTYETVFVGFVDVERIRSDGTCFGKPVYDMSKLNSVIADSLPRHVFAASECEGVYAEKE